MTLAPSRKICIGERFSSQKVEIPFKAHGYTSWPIKTHYHLVIQWEMIFLRLVPNLCSMRTPPWTTSLMIHTLILIYMYKLGYVWKIQVVPEPCGCPNDIFFCGWNITTKLQLLNGWSKGLGITWFFILKYCLSCRSRRTVSITSGMVHGGVLMDLVLGIGLKGTLFFVQY